MDTRHHGEDTRDLGKDTGRDLGRAVLKALLGVAIGAIVVLAAMIGISALALH